MASNNFKSLLIWQRSIDFARKIYQLSLKFPASEKFGLISQIQRASISVAANIAEGYARNTKKEFSQFLYISCGSLAEVDTYLEFSVVIGYTKKDEVVGLILEKEEIRKMIVAFVNKLNN